MKPSRPLVFSYRRFSSGRQARGSSLGRQKDAAALWCAEHGLELDESLALADLGVSAYKGDNVARGALAGFLAAISAGKVPRGSYLVVESLDRLSRAALPEAIGLLTSIVRAGVKVVSLIDNKVWDETTIEDSLSFMLSVLLFSRAHEESSTKAKRVSAAFQRKREAALPVVSIMHGPGWVAPKSDGSGWKLVKDKAAAVRRVFKLAAEGRGGIAIGRVANEEGWTVPWRPRVNASGRWEHTAISRLLRDRRVLGEWQPRRVVAGRLVADGDPVVGYFPAAIDEELWHRAQLALQGRTGPKRIRGITADIFSGLLVCKCGERMERKPASERGHARYYCAGRIAGVSQCPPLSEAALLDTLVGFVGFVEQQTFRGDEVATHRENAELAEARAEDARGRAAKLLTALEAAGHSELLLRRLRDVEAEIVKAEQEAAAARELMAAVPTLDRDFGDELVAKAKRAVLDRSAVAERRELAFAFNRLLNRIEWHGDCLLAITKANEGFAVNVPAEMLNRAKRRDAGTKKNASNY